MYIMYINIINNIYKYISGNALLFVADAAWHPPDPCWVVRMKNNE